jgi:hypothetical protein
VKARLVRNDPVAAVAARTGSTAAVAIGPVELIDPASPGTVLRSPLRSATAPLGVVRFVRDNASELAGAALDLVTGKLGGPIPPHRVVLAIGPTAVASVDGRKVQAHGRWSTGHAPSGGQDEDADFDGDTEIDLADVPEHLAALAVSGDAVVGWLRHDGSPLALPVEWDADGRRACLPTALFERCGGAADSPACVTFDTWTGFGPSGKQGLMLRGSGRATTDRATTLLALDVRRATYWDGIDTSTTDVA